MIDVQIPAVMPAALPVPDSSDPVSFTYWSKYLDYIEDGEWIGTPPPPPDDDGDGGGGDPPDDPDDPPPPPPPPEPPIGLIDGARLQQLIAAETEPKTIAVTAAAGDLSALKALAAPSMAMSMGPGVPRRGAYEYMYLPPSTDSDEITDFNNPNENTFPSASVPWDYRNLIGYQTYVQFMMDWGRDRSPDVGNSTNADASLGTKTPLSLLSPHCPRHNEATAGGTFSFPPREQPMHAVRRALIAALQEVKDQNAGLASGAGDRVAIVTYDGQDGYHAPQLVLPLTANYDNAMAACVDLQATSDIGATTATEPGLILARQHLAPTTEGGQGRPFANPVYILLTDGIPNVWQTADDDIDQYQIDNPSGEFYGGGYYWLDAALIQAFRIEDKKQTLFPVGMGLGADYDFLDRMARIAGTDEGGLSPRGTGNPADYEQQLINIFTDIIRNPGSRLVQ